MVKVELKNMMVYPFKEQINELIDGDYIEEIKKREDFDFVIYHVRCKSVSEKNITFLCPVCKAEHTHGSGGYDKTEFDRSGRGAHCLEKRKKYCKKPSEFHLYVTERTKVE
jgi:hypothetical protein